MSLPEAKFAHEDVETMPGITSLDEDPRWADPYYVPENPKPGEIEWEDDETEEEKAVWTQAAKVAQELRSEPPLDATQLVNTFEGKVTPTSPERNPEERLAAGMELKAWTSRRQVDALVAAQCQKICAALIRNEGPPKLRAVASALLANVCSQLPLVVLEDRDCVVAVSGAYACDGDSECVLDACWVLCEAARREFWGAILSLDAMVELTGTRLFSLCCCLQGNDVARTDIEEKLVVKTFELVWRLREHRGSSAFAKLHKLDVMQSVLTAGIDYMFDKRAYSNDVNRHRLTGPVSQEYPSGLDVCMRALLGFAEIDFELVTKDDNDLSAHRRLSRMADAARTVRCSGELDPNETITVELLVTTAMQKIVDKNSDDDSDDGRLPASFFFKHAKKDKAAAKATPMDVDETKDTAAAGSAGESKS